MQWDKCVVQARMLAMRADMPRTVVVLDRQAATLEQVGLSRVLYPA